VASAFYSGPLTPAAAWSRLAADIGVWHLQGFGVWAIHDRQTGQVLGVCGFWQGKGWPRELTWWLLPGARGQGIALEASRVVIHHAFNHLHWPLVQTYMNDSNAAARALVWGAKRLGGRCFRRGWSGICSICPGHRPEALRTHRPPQGRMGD
jgi:RimJ/RimL family protein N-acetyltransferase